jgi:ubiquinone/menaquinone biosynthesis C-methylase UbiE
VIITRIFEENEAFYRLSHKSDHNKNAGCSLGSFIKKVYWYMRAYYLVLPTRGNPYESKYAVSKYLLESQLQKPEETILQELKTKLPTMRMLDLGVGAGRTTTSFAPLIANYVGVDSSQSMIAACQLKFRNDPKITFKVSNVTNLGSFQARTFDFVLFSFNGIDNLKHEDRLRALGEIHRVTKTEDTFVFQRLT